MKRLIYVFSALAITFFLVHCGSSTENENGTDTDSSIVVEEVVTGLTPDDVDLNNPITVADLHKAFFAWEAQTVTVVGYCDFFFDEGSVGTRVKLLASPDSDVALVEITMKQSYDEEFNKNVPVQVTGVIKNGIFDYITLIDGELVAKGDDVQSTVTADPFNSTPEKPMKVDDFYKSYNGWMDKKVTVIGNFWGMTESTTDYGVTWRIDLTDPVTGEKLVGCRMIEKIGDVTKRDNMVIVGEVKGTFFDQVLLENCEITSPIQ